MNLSPEIMEECERIAKKITLRLGREFEAFFASKKLKEVDAETFSIIPLCIIGQMVASNAHALALSYRNKGNKAVTGEKIFNLIHSLSVAFFKEMQKNNPLYRDTLQ